MFYPSNRDDFDFYNCCCGGYLTYLFRLEYSVLHIGPDEKAEVGIQGLNAPDRTKFPNRSFKKIYQGTVPNSNGNVSALSTLRVHCGYNITDNSPLHVVTRSKGMSPLSLPGDSICQNVIEGILFTLSKVTAPLQFFSFHIYRAPK